MCQGRSVSGSGRGRDTRENAGISSENVVRNYIVESLRFPGEGSSAQGKPGAKARPKGVADEQRVDIPVPPTYDLSEAMTQKDSQTALMDICGQIIRLMCSEVRT